MTGTPFTLGFEAFVLGVIFGVLVGVAIMALLIGAREDDRDLVQQAADREASALLDYLDKSECSLFFNAQLGAWGLLDGVNRMVATAHTVRACLTRARDKDAAELAPTEEVLA